MHKINHYQDRSINTYDNNLGGVNCHLCGSSDLKTYLSIPDLMLDRKDIITVLIRCQQCGLIFQHPQLDAETMHDNYPEEYSPFLSTGAKLPKTIGIGIRRRAKYLLKQKTSGRLLDIGCATGEFLYYLKTRYGWAVQGVEASHYASELGRKKYNLDIINGTLDQAHFPAEYFDAITLWEVLEHLNHPTETLENIHRILKPDGVLIIRVPNHASWDAALFGKYWAGYDAPRHLFVFSPATITRLLEQAQYKICGMSCSMGGYPSFVISVQFWMTAKGYHKETRAKVARILNHPFVHLAAYPYPLVASFFLRGPTLTITSHKA